MSFNHKKKFGQNFLTNQNDVLSRIMEVAKVGSDEAILEIGPGEGALTELLLNAGKKVICVEIDRDLEKILMRKFGDNPKFQLIMKDVLTLDFEEEIKEKVKVVANIPYYITSPIINKLIENKEYVQDIFIMVQKEVAERVCAKNGKERSVLTLSVEYFGEANYLFTIPKEFFTPPPKVDSAFMSINLFKENAETDFEYLKNPNPKKTNTKIKNQEFHRMVLAVAGTFLYACGINFFISPEKLNAGGIMGYCQLVRTLLTDYLGMINIGTCHLYLN